MSRRRSAKKREKLPDYLYGSEVVTAFVNTMMWDGKKSVAESIFYKAIAIAAEKVSKDPMEVFENVLTTAAPQTEVRSKRLGGATYQIPHDVSEARGKTLAMRAIIEAARSRSERSMEANLAAEFIAIYSGAPSATIKKRDDMHKMSAANRAFSHFRV